MEPDTENLYYEIQSFGRDECLSCLLPECVYVNPYIDLKLCPLENIDADLARDGPKEVQNLRRQAILEALTSETSKCNKSEIAQNLKISRQTLYNDIDTLLTEGRLIKKIGGLTANSVFLLPQRAKGLTDD